MNIKQLVLFVLMVTLCDQVTTTTVPGCPNVLQDYEVHQDVLNSIEGAQVLLACESI